MTIRFFRDVDFDPVSRLLNEAYRKPGRNQALTGERLRVEFTERHSDPFENCVVLESPEGEVVGFCGYDPLPEGRALLDGPVLRPEIRHQGWGERLWEEVSNLARGRGIRFVAAVLGEDSFEAEDFLLRMGFEREKTDVIMVCDNRAGVEVSLPDGVAICTPTHPEFDLGDYEDLHAQLFTRRSLAYLGMLARSPGYHIFVAEKEGQAVGLLELEILEDVATIECFGVLEAYRRQGIGRALLAEALNLAWEHPQVQLVRQIWKAEQDGYLQVYLEVGFRQKATIRGLLRSLVGDHRN